MTPQLRFVIAGLILTAFVLHRPLLRWYRSYRYTRGRQVKHKTRSKPLSDSELRWGNSFLPESAAVRHFLVAGTTGSGKSLVQKLLMTDVLRKIRLGSDQRAIIFDAKGDSSDFLKEIGVVCEVHNFNPFSSDDPNSKAVVWDIAKDISSPARAQNLVASLVPSEKSGNNQYFTDAARQVLTGVVESLIRHSPNSWTFSDLVYVSLHKERIQSVLSRDNRGQEVLDSFFVEERTSYQVFTTIVSRMSYYKPVAALWQSNPNRLSIGDWLKSESIVLLGSNATVKTSLDAINQQIFRVMVEEIDIQTNSDSRRTWVWIDEARLAGSLLNSELLPYLAVKGRSRGAAIVIAFQDIDGFKEAAGERIANEIVAQCSNKALLRMESEASASWASKTVGQYETIESFHSENQSGWFQNISEQRVQRDAVLASEFFGIPVTNRTHGLTGYFITSEDGAYRGTISAKDLEQFNSESETTPPTLTQSLTHQQWLADWEEADYRRLKLDRALPESPLEQQRQKISRLWLRRNQETNWPRERSGSKC
ncbi:MAG: type IV secretion system DNA-binding domain-containing protein [Planctomycetota bacterium]